MKNIFKSSVAILIGLSLTVAGCKKSSSSSDTNNNNNNGVPVVPTTFSQKVLLEEFTGAWCGWCVDGHYNVSQIHSINPDMIPVLIHQGDGMELPEFNSYYNPTFNVTGFPTATVQRTKGADGKYPQSRPWNTLVANAYMAKPVLGLSIDATMVEDPSTVTPKIKIAFNADVTEVLNIGVYIVEDSVSGTGSAYDQSNYLAGRAGYESNPFYKLPGKIVGYKHNHVLRRTLYPSPAGSVLDATLTKKGGVIEFSKMFSYAGFVKDNCSIIAFVHTPGGKIYNAQIVKIGKAKAWD